MNLIRKFNSVFPNRLAGCRTGATAVEFALIVPLFLVMTIGIFEIGRALWVKSMMQYAVEETTRYAMVRASSSYSATDLETYAQNKLIFEQLAEIGGSIDITFTATIGASDVTVSASYDYEFLFSISGLLDLASDSTGTSISFTLTATSKAPLIN